MSRAADLVRLEEKSRQMRIATVKTVYWAGGGHLGGALSVTDILTVLYFYTMRIQFRDPCFEERDRLILSKGHAGIGLAPFLADIGYIDKEILKTFNHTNSTLGMHLDMRKVPGVEASTGSLGHGLSLGAGLALAARIRRKDYRTFVILGDGECNEGSVWEAAMAISHYRLSNLITIIDRNHLMYDGDTEAVLALEPLKEKWASFGFRVFETDGHDIAGLCSVFDAALAEANEPCAVICRTIKGCGVAELENRRESHYVSISDEAMLQRYIDSVNEYHNRRSRK